MYLDISHYDRTDATTKHLNHPAEEFVDLLLAVAEITTFNVVVRLLAPATSGGVQLDHCKMDIN